jgi:hypothetical protein
MMSFFLVVVIVVGHTCRLPPAIGGKTQAASLEVAGTPSAHISTMKETTDVLPSFSHEIFGDDTHAQVSVQSSGSTTTAMALAEH